MELYPAIDLFEGQVVRLTKGDFARKTVYSSEPALFAKKWAEAGTRWIHIVDLEGAKTGIQKNLPAVLKIRETVPCKIQFGGGLRTLDAIDQILSHGIDRAIVGTKAMDRKFLEAASKRFGNRLAVGLDVRDGVVQTQGWLDGQNPTLTEALQLLNETSIEMIIYTDIHKDGMMAGPNFEGLQSVLKTANAKVILSGGVSSMNDLKICAQISEKNFEGPIIGKALYEGAINLLEAVSLAKARVK